MAKSSKKPAPAQPGEFENPGAQEPTGGTSSSQFEEPDMSDDAASAAASVDAEMAAPEGTARGVAQLKAAIESLLVRQAGPMVEGFTLSADSLTGPGNIQGVGFALGDPSGGGEPGVPSLVVFTAEPASEDDVKGVLSDARAASDDDLDAVAVTVVQTGIIDAFAHRFRARPVPGGVSVGHFQITAGTTGGLWRGRTGDRQNRLFVLSNNHVLANVNAGPLGAAILQPGPADGGAGAQSRIGVLERFVPINFSSGASNLVDCATAWVTSGLVRREFVQLVNGQQQFFGVSNQLANAQVGMLVGKSGRTTQLTQGRVTAIGVTVNVNFGNGRVGTFRDQFSVVSTTSGGNFSQGGDSGSLIWTWNPTRNPVGLLFAGGGGVTFANRIDRVAAALDIVKF